MRVRALLATLSAVVCLSSAVDAFARGGDADGAFGTRGTAALQTTIAADVRVLGPVVGDTVVSVGSHRLGIQVQRTLNNGEPDPSFGTHGVVTLPAAITVSRVAAQPDGSIILAGPKLVLFSTGPLVTTWGFTRLGPNGSIDTSFGDGGWSFVAPVDGIASLSTLQVLPDGRIAAVMFPGDQDGLNVGHVAAARLLANGKPDPAFGVSGVVDHAFGGARTTNTLCAARVLADGTVEVARGVAATIAASRLAPDGTWDMAFGAGGMRTTPMPVSLVVGATKMDYLPDGSLVVANDAVNRQVDPLTPAYIFSAARVMPDGNLQFSFGVQGVLRADVSASEPTSILATTDGDIVVVGTTRAAGLELVKIDARLGRLAARFARQGVAEVPVAVEAFHAETGAMGADGFVTIIGMSDGGSGGLGTWLVRVQVVDDVVEFHNEILDHYFITYDGAEAVGIDAGAAGPGWSRTAASFRPGGPASVCRFYGTPGIGPNSHFYTAEPDECDAVRLDPGWTYEGVGFYTTRPVDGACAAPLVPVHRLYNDGFAHGIDSNHRYVTDVSLIAPMVTRGWIHEGVVFCAKP